MRPSTKATPGKAAGFGLLELIVSLAILVIIVAALVRLQSTVIKGSQVALDVSAIARALYLVQADIVRNDRFLPPQEFPAAANPLDATTLDPFLDDPEMADTRCYSRVGLEVRGGDANIESCRDNPSTYFRITYVKFRQPDVSFYQNGDNPTASPGNELNRIPIGHYRMRIDYDPDSAGAPQKKMFVSRVVTSSIVY